MCKEVFEIVKQMDLSKVETRLALQCAPVILGIKISNLLIVSSMDEALVGRILDGTQIDFYCLSQQDKKTIYLLFRSMEFEAYLSNPNVQGILRRFGYQDLSFSAILQTFHNRYVTYVKNGKDFPHEMGLLLGYPTEDVEGFINNKGKNYLYAGYWKVYQNVEEKKLLFEAYENAKEGLVLLVANGYSIRPVIECFQDNGYEVIYTKEFEKALVQKEQFRYIYQRE